MMHHLNNDEFHRAEGGSEFNANGNVPMHVVSFVQESDLFVLTQHWNVKSLYLGILQVIIVAQLHQNMGFVLNVIMWMPEGSHIIA